MHWTSRLALFHTPFALCCLLVLIVSAPLAAATPATSEAAPAAQTTQHHVYLPLTVMPAALPPSEQLIDQALSRGEINAETALVYKVYATFADPRLPAKYRGNDSNQVHSDGVEEVAEKWNTLSAATRALLEPFTIPPAYTRSWANTGMGVQNGTTIASTPTSCGLLASNWSKLDSTNGKVRVWWETANVKDAAMARTIVNEVDTTIWKKLIDLMGRENISDKDQLCNSGDGRLDIYLVGLGGAQKEKGFNWTYPISACGTKPTYIEINHDLPANELRSTVAHEIMHAIQWAFPVETTCSREEYKWWMEATATWSMHYVYPTDNLEQDYATHLLDAPHLELELHKDDKNPNHAYGAYLFPFFLQNKFSPAFIKQTWDHAASNNSLEAIDHVLGGLTTAWKEFVLHNWNDEPKPYNKYQDPSWDSFTQQAKLELDQDVSLKGIPSAYQKLLPVDLNHLSARYYRFTFTDDTARGVTFYNGLTYKAVKESTGNSAGLALEPISDDLKEGASVQALVKIGGVWKKEDWTDTPIKFFCRDKIAENVEELVIVLSNGQWKERSKMLKPQGEPPILAASNAGCFRWKGTVTTTTESHHIDGHSFIKSSMHSTITWDQAPPLTPVPDMAFRNPAYVFVPTGTVAWKYDDEVWGDEMSLLCVGKGEATIPITTVIRDYYIEENFLHLSAGAVYTGPRNRLYHAHGRMPKIAPITDECYASPVRTRHVDLEFINDNNPMSMISADGLTITGRWEKDCSDDMNQCVTTSTWTFKAERE